MAAVVAARDHPARKPLQDVLTAIRHRSRVSELGYELQSNSERHLQTLEKLQTGGLQALVPGHGPASLKPTETLDLTRRYLAHMRETFRAGVEELMSFEEIYASADWSQFEHLPAFADGNRINAYQVYLSLENELLDE